MSSKTSVWEKTKASSKRFFDKVGEPVNKASNKLGAEAFWPTNNEKESEKAARILRSFCLDGFNVENQNDKQRWDKIPPEVIRNCKGLAIFTVMRAGFGWSGAGGSGVLVAKTANGTWSPPAGILIHTLGWGFIAGADIYDCVCVINSEKGMENFTRVRCTLGGEVSAAVGPLGGGSQLESTLRDPRPVWVYTKSKGLYVGVQIDGTVIVERTSENERFYHREGVRNTQILGGQVQPPPGTVTQLWETLQAAEGSSYDQNKIPPSNQMSPGDHQLDAPRQESHKEYDEFADHQERMDAQH